MTKKKPEPNPIEEAIGERAKTLKPSFPQNPNEIPDEPTPSEMLTLEELNRQTEERLRDDPEPQEPNWKKMGGIPMAKSPPKKEIPVSKLDPQPVPKTSSQESPPVTLDSVIEANQKQNEINEKSLPPQKEDDLTFELNEDIEIRGCSLNLPAEDVELTALRKYILEDGFVLATVAFHIVSLCAQPMTTPSTTMWDFRDRAMIPDMVLALLYQPGYLEGIWPSLKIVMGSNKGNAAWTAGIATTIAFFDCIRTLPAIEELKKDVDK